jgi:regulator of ribonuclease activity A
MSGQGFDAPQRIVRTADVVDTLRDAAHIFDPGHLKSYGGLTAFGGPVETVRAPEDNVLLRKTLSETGQGRILVVDGLGSRRVALLGGDIASMAARNGWSGCIINGCVRDVNELANIRLGVFAIAACPRKSLKEGSGSCGQTIRLLGVTVAPGNYLYADEDGIVVCSSPFYTYQAQTDM